MLHWGILSTGRIASVFAKGVLRSSTGKVVAVASRSREEAERFGLDKHGDFYKGVEGIARYGSYEAMLADKNVHAVYIATPHPMHAVWAIKCAEAGKHVLCEKPIALNHAEAMMIFEAARANGVFAMEAFMYRCHPIIAKILATVKDGAIGQVRGLQATFSFNAGDNWTGRLLANELGGGGVLDVGCYPMSLARAVAGAAMGRWGPAEPSELKAVGQITQTGVDGYTTAAMKFDTAWGGIVANLATGVRCQMENVVRIYGTEGQINLNRWVPGEKENKFFIIKGDKTEEVICDGPAGQTPYTMEADEVARAVAAGEQQGRFPAMSWNDTLGNMKALDLWRREIGVVYESERAENGRLPISGRPLAVKDGSLMRFGRIAGVDKPVSRVVLGVDNQFEEQYPHAAAMFDDYFERGGNAFDTGYIYGGGRCEPALGWWVKQRGVRGKVVILGKGAHTPHCDPSSLTRELKITLERLKTDYVDIYMMHRDNPAVPVGEFADVLGEHRRAGRMRAYGASNWLPARVDEFNAYARKKGLPEMAAISNNLALAATVGPVWAGCIGSNNPEHLAWLEKTQMTIMPWSSQARGFFVWGDENDLGDADFVRCWHSRYNFQRLRRAKELAARKNCRPINIALAWVLHQPFPTFPLIGPRSIEETRVAFDALKVSLTPQEVKWLNLQD